MKKLLRNHWFWMGMTVIVVAIVLLLVAPQITDEDAKTDVAEVNEESRDSEPTEDSRPTEEPEEQYKVAEEEVKEVKESEEAELHAEEEKKQINLKMENESWPAQKSKTINEGFEGLKDPFEYKLKNAVKVYGLSHIANQLSFGATYEYRFKNRSPACVYSFSDNNFVGEMHAIWDLGGRFLLRNEGVVLGGDGANLDPEIMKDRHKAGDELVLEANDTGRKLLDDYCSVMGIPPGSLQITLPGDLWAAVYQTLFKVAVVDNEIDVNTVFMKDKEVSWRLKGNRDGYSIIIQKSDLE